MNASDYNFATSSLAWREEYKPVIKYISEYVIPAVDKQPILAKPIELTSADVVDKLFYFPQNIPFVTSPFLYDPFVKRIRIWMAKHKDSIGTSGINHLLEKKQINILRQFAKTDFDLPRRDELIEMQKTSPDASSKWRSLYEANILFALATEHLHPFDGLVIRVVFDHLKHSPNEEFPNIRDIPEFQPFVPFNIQSSLKWELFDLILTDSYLSPPSDANVPWNDYVYCDPGNLLPRDEERWWHLMNVLVWNYMDKDLFGEILCAVNEVLSSGESLRQTVPIMVFAFYLRCFHKRFAMDISERVIQVMRAFCNKKKPGFGDYAILDRELFTNIQSYAMAMEACIDSSEPIFPVLKRRGRRPPLQGLLDAFKHLLFELITDEVIRVVSQQPAEVLQLDTAYAFQRPKINRYSIAACFVSACLGENVTAESIRNAIKRSRNNPEKYNLLCDTRLKSRRKSGPRKK